MAASAIQRDGERLIVEGPVNLDTVPQLLASGLAKIREGATVLDFSKATEIDSAAVALVLAFARAGAAAGKSLTLAHTPPAMEKLASLYAITDVLPPRADSIKRL